MPFWLGPLAQLTEMQSDGCAVLRAAKPVSVITRPLSEALQIGRRRRSRRSGGSWPAGIPEELTVLHCSDDEDDGVVSSTVAQGMFGSARHVQHVPRRQPMPMEIGRASCRERV